MRALSGGDAAAARALVQNSDVTSHTLAIALPLLAGLEGRSDQGLTVLSSLQSSLRPEEVAVAVAVPLEADQPV